MQRRHDLASSFERCMNSCSGPFPSLAHSPSAGEPIRPGTQLWISPWVLHRHREFWDHSTAFVPERFAGKLSHWTNNGAFLPFGAGPRPHLSGQHLRWPKRRSCWRRSWRASNSLWRSAGLATVKTPGRRRLPGRTTARLSCGNRLRRGRTRPILATQTGSTDSSRSHARRKN